VTTIPPTPEPDQPAQDQTQEQVVATVQPWPNGEEKWPCGKNNKECGSMNSTNGKWRLPHG
jgi:hypothetical protein